LNPLLGIIAGLGLLTGLLAPVRADDAPVSNEQISAAIKKGVDWIYRQQNSWGTWQAGKEPLGVQRDMADEGQFGFKTALALYALLQAGESERDPRLQPAIDFLIINDRIAGVYAVGMRAQVWGLLTPTPAIREAMIRDWHILHDALHTQGKTKGLYSYRTDYENEPEYADHSLSFFATLGVKSLAGAGLEIPDSYWSAVQSAWRSQQLRDGSWVFQIGSTSRQEHTMSMTAAGVAVLFAAGDALAAGHAVDCRAPRADHNIDNGLTWIDSNFSQSQDPHELFGINLANYGLFAIARIGLTSGRKYFNQRDWYEDGARLLLASQDKANGSWGNLPDTCFAVSFLERGRDPVLVSKLQYDIIPGRPPGSGSPRPGNWNMRPRDMAALTDWIGPITTGKPSA
jgi:hypothetical protein